MKGSGLYKANNDFDSDVIGSEMTTTNKAVPFGRTSHQSRNAVVNSRTASSSTQTSATLAPLRPLLKRQFNARTARIQRSGCQTGGLGYNPITKILEIATTAD